MMRRNMQVRQDHREIAAREGFTFADDYWDESVAYEFSLREIEERIELPTTELNRMCEDVVDRVVGSEELLRKLEIPEGLFDAVRASWRSNRFDTLYGRMDFSFNGIEPIKLLEFNADTPTSLYEAGVYQWLWMEDQRSRGVLPEDVDQFNSIHDSMVERWKLLLKGKPLTLACMKAELDDAATLEYIAHLAREAGSEAHVIDIEAIEAPDKVGGFYRDTKNDLDITTAFKLYPWEWMMREAGATTLALSGTRWVEPMWKVILSSKGLLPLLWRFHKGHPNLLPAYFRDDHTSPPDDLVGKDYVTKPLVSREGQGVTIYNRGRAEETTEVGERPVGVLGTMVVQQRADMWRIGSGVAVMGSWIVGHKSCGIGIREQREGLITDSRAKFVPHVILG